MALLLRELFPGEVGLSKLHPIILSKAFASGVTKISVQLLAEPSQGLTGEHYLKMVPTGSKEFLNQGHLIGGKRLHQTCSWFGTWAAIMVREHQAEKLDIWKIFREVGDLKDRPLPRHQRSEHLPAFPRPTATTRGEEYRYVICPVLICPFQLGMGTKKEEIPPPLPAYWFLHLYFLLSLRI